MDDQYIQDAIARLSYLDISEADFTQAVIQTAQLLAGGNFELLETELSIDVYTALRF